jgi:comEA protein
MIRTYAALLLAALLAAVQPLHAEPQKGGPSAPPRAAAPAMVNINTAGAPELETLPGVGAKTASLIIEYRQKNGPFKKIEELMNVKGFGEKTFLKLKPQLTVGASKSDGGQH